MVPFPTLITPPLAPSSTTKGVLASSSPPAPIHHPLTQGMAPLSTLIAMHNAPRKPHPAPGRVLMPSSPPAAPPHQEGHGALVILDHHAKLGRCEEAIRAGAAHIASHTNPTDSLGGGRGAACRGNLGITHAAHIRGSTTHAAHIRGNTMQRTSEVAPCPLCKTPLL